MPVVQGCTDPTAINYDSSANVDDSSCISTVLGCTDSTQFNYNPNANVDDGSCIPITYGCTDANAFNYDAAANTNDGSCLPFAYGCTDATADNYDAGANTACNTTDPNQPTYDGSSTFDLANNNACCTYPPPLAIGDTYEGGIIFYLDGLGGGMVVDNEDFLDSNSNVVTLKWGCSGTVTNANGLAIGTGAQNTADIDAVCSDTGVDCAADFILGNNINGNNYKGYNDWFLPSYDELIEIYNAVGPGASGTNTAGDSLTNIANLITDGTPYWSSTELIAAHTLALSVQMNDGSTYNHPKNISVYFRAVRTF